MQRDHYPTFGDSIQEFNPYDFEKYWKNMENNIDVKSVITELTEQAYKKCVISIAMKLKVSEDEIKIRRNIEGDMMVIVDKNPVGHITIAFVYNPDTFSNSVVVNFHQHA